MSKSPQRKTIHNIITNIRQMASNISKDVSNAQPIVLPSPPPKQHQESSLTKSNKCDSIQIRLAKSARLTLSSESNPIDTQPSPDLHEIAQGIQNAHAKVDEALRFMTNMKHKLDSDPLPVKTQAVTSNKPEFVKVRSLVDQSKLSAQNTQQLMSFPDLHRPQETPSLGVLPLTLEDLKTNPVTTTGAAVPYFGHADVPYFNPFSKSVTHKSSEAFAGIAQNNPSFSMSTMGSNPNLLNTVPSLNLGTNPNFIQMMKNQTDNNTKISPAYTPSTTLPSSTFYQQPSACDHNRLNQIVSSIKHRDHSLSGQVKTTPYQPQSLNDLQYSSVNSLTSVHEQLTRPNTVSHLSKPPLRSNWFVPPNETNFRQVPLQNNGLSHYASQNSLHEIKNRHRPNMTTTTFANTTSYQQPSMYMNSYIGGQRVVGSFHSDYSEEQFYGEEEFKPRRLTFEDPRSKKNSPYINEVKQRRPVQGESQYKVQKTARRRSDVRQKRPNMYEDLANDEDRIANRQCCCEHHHQYHNRKTSRYSEYTMNQAENSVMSQSEEESFEESIEYEQQKPRKAKEQLCSNCQCQKPIAQQTHVTHVDVGSGKVCGSQRRSNSRKQQSMIVQNGVAAHNKIQVNEPEEMEYQSQVPRRNKSIDNNAQPKPNVRRKTHIALVKPRTNEKQQNNENITEDSSQQSEKNQRISFEVLRKKDENQSVLQRRSVQVNTKKIAEKRDSKNSLYDKEFVDQLAIDFPAMGEKAREQTEFKTVAAQKTEIVLAGIKKPRRVLG